jgi:hypothetical protein
LFKTTQDIIWESEEAKILEEELALMFGRCMGCFMTTGKVNDGQFHSREECPVWGARKWRQVKRCEDRWQQGLFKKGMMSDFSSCFWCGLPQSVCTHWEAVGEDQGRFRIRKDGECQYAGLLVSVWGAAYCTNYHW